MTSDPPRLTSVGATELERRLLDAAAAERPSPELTHRMGIALGFSSPGAPAVPTPSAAPARTSTTATSTAMTTKAVWTWASAGVLAVAISAGAVGVWTSSRAPRQSASLSGSASVPAPALASTAAPPEAAPEVPVAAAAAPPVGPAGAAARPAAAVPRHAGPVTNARDLHGEIALIDAVRAAIQTGGTGRALALLRRYDAAYSGGTLRPEADALRVEALARSGQMDRARALAREFLARHPDSPLGERVARIAGQPPG